MTQHLSMKGEPVDFNKLRMQNGTQPALGNANMNARGDILNEQGIIIKTQEQIEEEWASKLAEQREITQPANIKDAASVAAAAGVSPIPTPPAKQVDFSDKDFEPDNAAKTRRKIVESD